MWDTISGFEYIQLDTNILLGKGWRFIAKKNELYKSYYFYNKGSIQLFYYPLTKNLIFKLSVPTVIFRTNTIMAYQKDIHLLDKKFRIQVFKATGKYVKPLTEFYVSRIDFCYNFFVKKPEHKQYYIDAYKKSTQSFLNLRIYKTTAFFVNKSSSVKFYDKSAELNSRNIPIENAKINNILRFELEYKRDKVKYLFGKKVKFKELLKDSVAKTELSKYLNKIFPEVEPKSAEEVDNILNSRYKCKGHKEPKMKTKLLEFLNSLEKSTIAETTKVMKISYKTAMRYIKVLTELGINPFILQSDGITTNVLKIKILSVIQNKYVVIYIILMILTSVGPYYSNDYG